MRDLPHGTMSATTGQPVSVDGYMRMAAATGFGLITALAEEWEPDTCHLRSEVGGKVVYLEMEDIRGRTRSQRPTGGVR